MDVDTLQLAMAVSFLIMAAPVMLLRRAEGMAAPVRLWLASRLCLSGGFLLYFFTFVWPRWLSVHTGNLLTLAGYFLEAAAVYAYRRRDGRRLRLVALGSLLLTLAFSAADIANASRLALVSLVFALPFGLIARAHLASWRQASALRRALGAAMLGVCLAVLVRGIAVPFLDPSEVYAYRDLFSRGFFLLVFVAGQLHGFGFIFLLKERADEELERLASLDPLTEVLNRRSFLALARGYVANAGRHAQPLALLLVDIDHFKRINDSYGHHAGDDALLALVACLRAGLRDGDLLGRWGGEEFVLMLPQTELAGAEALAERLRQSFAAWELVRGSPALRATLSLGATAWREGEDLAVTIDRADAALYRAKEGGRNRVCSL